MLNDSLGFRIDENPGKEMLNNVAVPALLQSNIAIVLAAGNDALLGISQDKITPQNLNGANSDLITVGGVDSSGILYDRTTPDIGNGGSINIYGGAVDVPLADFLSNDGTRFDTGTSFAAPAIVSIVRLMLGRWNADNYLLQAGMGAYFLGLSSVRSNPSVNLNAIPTALKGFFTTTDNGPAVQRNSNPVPNNLPYTTPQPETILVAFNKAPEG